MLAWLSSWIWEENLTDPNAVNVESKSFLSYPARNFPFLDSSAHSKLKEISLQKQVEEQLQKLRKIKIPPRPKTFPVRHPVLKQLLNEIPRIE